MLSGALVCTTVQPTLYSATHKCAVKCQEIAGGIEIALKSPKCLSPRSLCVCKSSNLPCSTLRWSSSCCHCCLLWLALCAYSRKTCWRLTLNYLWLECLNFHLVAFFVRKCQEGQSNSHWQEFVCFVKRLQVWRLKMHRSVPAFHVVRVVSEGVMLNCW